MSYAHLYFAANTEDADRGHFYQTVHEQVNAISTVTLFFTLELNRLPEAVLRKQLKNRTAARYASWIRDVRVFRPHMLDDDLEKILHEKSVTGRASWVRLFDETQSALRFPMGRKRLTMSEVLNLLSDRDGEKRKRAAKALGKVLGENVRLFTLITNTLAKDKRIEDEWRHYPSPLSSRNLVNFVEDEVVEALTSSVADAFPDLSHRYYRLKARWFGKRKLDYWDRNAPLPGDSGRRYSWREARELVLSAYGRFAPEMAETAKRFFTNDWIDAVPRAGKDSGAFSHSTVPSAHTLYPDELSRQGARRDDPRPRTRAWRASGAGRTPRDADVGYAAYPRRNGIGLRRDADLPCHARRRGRSRPPAHPACRQGRGHVEHGGASGRLSPFRGTGAR